MPTFGTCANHGKTWYLLWWSLQMEDQAARSFTSSIITFSSFLSNPFKKVVCFFFFSRHPWNHTNCQGCSHRGRQSHNSGWRDRPTPGSRYKWIMLWHNDMLLHQHASNLEIKKLKWIFVDSSPPPHVATHHFFRNFIKEVFNFFAWKGRSSTNICTAMIHRSTRLSDVNWVYWAASAAGFSGQMTANLVNDVTMLPFSIMWVVDAGPIFALGSTMNMARAWSVSCSHWFSATGGFILSRVNMKDDQTKQRGEMPWLGRGYLPCKHPVIQWDKLVLKFQKTSKNNIVHRRFTCLTQYTYIHI